LLVSLFQTIEEFVITLNEKIIPSKDRKDAHHNESNCFGVEVHNQVKT